MSRFFLKHKTPLRRRYGSHDINLKCDTDALSVRLESINGVKKAKVNPIAHTFTLYAQDGGWDAARVEKELLNVEFGAFVGEKIPKRHIHSESSASGLWRSLGALALSTAVSGNGTKLLITSLASFPLFARGVNDLIENGVTSKVLEAMAVGVSLARSDYLAANSTNALLELGEYIEETTAQRSDELIKELGKPNIDKVWIEEIIDGQKVLKQIPSTSVKVGNIVVVGTGETVAIDGHVIAGVALVNQASMTGESEPAKKERGDRIMSGVIIKEGQVKIWAEQVGDNTATARIKHYILSSLEEKSAIGLKATKLADKLVPITLGLSALSYLVTQNTQNVASVLQADYSCALKLATPVAFKSAIAQAGKSGILIKGAKVLEALSDADTFVFDKTGTLTHGELEVISVTSFDENWSKEEILNLTASTEEHYFHPVAEAVVRAAKKLGFIHMHHEEVEFIVAHGVKTIVSNKEVVIGSRHFLEDDERVSFEGHENKINKSLEEGKTILYVGYDGKLLGMIEMFDKVRENAKSVIRQLKDLGIKKIVMLTGDVSSRAYAIGEELGIDEVHANMLPQTKAKVINKLKSEGLKVVFVGDGINDAPALMNANVGVSMFKGADITKATADISLMKDDIQTLVEIKVLANRAIERIHKHFNATVGVNSAILLGASTGLLTPVTTALLHNGTTIALLLNSMKKLKVGQNDKNRNKK
ncbi:MAG: heavy metal translocating P-type ATPase [Campylobacteraceae bacterium]|nr:heavy metal translocating P-type ATPase [Campylobacteraceae bacterium]